MRVLTPGEESLIIHQIEEILRDKIRKEIGFVKVKNKIKVKFILEKVDMMYLGHCWRCVKQIKELWRVWFTCFMRELHYNYQRFGRDEEFYKELINILNSCYSRNLILEENSLCVE